MVISILHRATGVFLGIGAALFISWLAAIASGPDGYNIFRSLMGSLIGQLILMAIIYSLILHLMNGVRHLVWDVGKGFKLETVKRSGQMVMLLSLIASVGLWHLAGLLPGSG